MIVFPKTIFPLTLFVYQHLQTFRLSTYIIFAGIRFVEAPGAQKGVGVAQTATNPSVSIYPRVENVALTGVLGFIGS